MHTTPPQTQRVTEPPLYSDDNEHIQGSRQIYSFLITCTRILGLCGEGKGIFCIKCEMCLEKNWK